MAGTARLRLPLRLRAEPRTSHSHATASAASTESPATSVALPHRPAKRCRQVAAGGWGLRRRAVLGLATSGSSAAHRHDLRRHVRTPRDPAHQSFDLALWCGSGPAPAVRPQQQDTRETDRSIGHQLQQLRELSRPSCRATAALRFVLRHAELVNAVAEQGRARPLAIQGHALPAHRAAPATSRAPTRRTPIGTPHAKKAVKHQSQTGVFAPQPCPLRNLSPPAPARHRPAQKKSRRPERMSSPPTSHRPPPG